MKDLMTDDALTQKLTQLSKDVMHTVIDEVDHADEAEFVLSFCRDFVLGHMESKDRGERWFREEKGTIKRKDDSRTEESNEERMQRLHGAFYKVMKVLEELNGAEDAFFVLSCCRNAMRNVFELPPDAIEAAENAAAVMGKDVADWAKAKIIAEHKA